MNLITNIQIFILGCSLAGCAGMNPNPGEQTTDTNWEMGKYSRALKTVQPFAERGEPWAELRMGMYYEQGYGVKSNQLLALEWYKKAASQERSGKWAEGYLVGASGKAGYFGQLNDALIAQYRLADIYYNGYGVEKDYIKSYLLIKNVVTKSEGNNVFFCCEWSPPGRWFTPEMFNEIASGLETVMTQEQLREAENMSIGGLIQNGL